jgi:hypothetical protein
MHKAEINNLVKAYLDNGGRIQKIPTSRIKKHTNLEKPNYYLNRKSLSRAKANNAYVSTEKGL